MGSRRGRPAHGGGLPFRTGVLLATTPGRGRRGPMKRRRETVGNGLPADGLRRTLRAAGTRDVTAEDGYWAAWGAEQARQNRRGGARPEH